MTTRRNLLLVPFGTLILSRRHSTRDRPAALPATRFVFGGDVMLARYVGRLARDHGDPALSFRDLAPFLADADVTFVNLESPFSDRSRIADGGMVFRAAPEMVAGLTLAGVDVVSTANNHARDCGSYGMGYTLNWLSRNGILATGTTLAETGRQEGVVLERNGVRFGFLAYTYDQSNGNYPASDPRVAMLDAARMREDVIRLRERADVVVVSMHAGDEYKPLPNAQQIEFARFAIDAGARIVVGHHPHVVQPVEHYRNGLILYSLGNLVFDQIQRKETQQGLLARVTFRGRNLEGVELLPVEIVRTSPRLRSLGGSF